jgi:hypothetical protein
MTSVIFNDGTYGIRRGLLWHRYLDLENGRYWWSASSKYFQDCKGIKERVRKYLMKNHDTGKPISQRDLIGD